ncbi:MAG: hypothetical protein J6M30_06395 [Bacteroidales bacterium]|nr:hypothetical protein [Bacteroidales bacterium]
MTEDKKNLMMKKEDCDRLKIVLKLSNVVEFNKWMESNFSYPIKESVIDNAIDTIKDIYSLFVNYNQDITDEYKTALEFLFAQYCMNVKHQIKNSLMN